MCSFISIINHNRKSGKTLISFNLAVSLALLGKKTLYCSDESLDSHSALLTDKNKVEIYDKFQSEPLIRDYSSSVLSSLDFISFNSSDFSFENERMLNLKSSLGEIYDFVILDPPSGLVGSFDFFMNLTDGYIIPMEITEKSFDSLAPLLARLNWEKENKKRNFIGFLPNRVEYGDSLGSIFKNLGMIFFKKYILDSIIPYLDIADYGTEEGGVDCGWSILDDYMTTFGISFKNLALKIMER